MSKGGSFNVFISYLVKRPDQNNNEGYISVVKIKRQNPPGFDLKASIKGKAKELTYDFPCLYLTVVSKRDLKV